VPLNALQQRMRKIRDDQYVLLRGFFHGADDSGDVIEGEQLHLRTVALEVGAGAIGRRLGDIGLDALRIKVTAINRHQQRVITPDGETILHLGDLLVLSGTVEALADAERALVRG
jgi:monovalent cation:H+ antiporter-2, CPA2 family